jgi:hypothetical protein
MEVHWTIVANIVLDDSQTQHDQPREFAEYTGGSPPEAIGWCRWSKVVLGARLFCHSHIATTMSTKGQIEGPITR